MMRSTVFNLLCFKTSVISRAAITALIVGPVLAMINHGDKLLSGVLTLPDLAKIGLTFLVPFAVSTISSVLVLREQDALRQQSSAAQGNSQQV